MPTANSSSVHTEETTTQDAPTVTYADWSRHSCYPDYLAAKRVYGILDSRKDRSREDRLDCCRSRAWFARHIDTGEVRVAANSCHLRWCPVCARARRNYITHEVAEWLRDLEHPKFLTLTLRHSTAPLSHQVYWLYSHFRTLRRRKEFRRAVPGGIWFFQIKKSSRSNDWHPHLHCLIHGRFLPHRHLKHMWHSITFGSTIVDIRPIRDPQKAASDAARYAASPGSLVGLSPPDACELVKAMHGRRICGTWGTGRGVSLRPPKVEDTSKWENVGSFSMVYGMRNHHAGASDIWKAWHTGTALEPGIVCDPLGEFLEAEGRVDVSQLSFEQIYADSRSPPV